MNEPSQKPRLHAPERITLAPEALIRINSWIATVRPKLKGSPVSRGDLVNWLITNHASDLSEAEMLALSTTFFDPMMALAWASKEITERHKAGEQIDVAAFMSAALMTNTKARRTRVSKPVVLGQS